MKTENISAQPTILRTFAEGDLLQIAMPMGGIGAGCICLNGNGGLQDFSIRHRPSATATPDGFVLTDSAFATVHIRGDKELTRLLEGPVPPEKLYDQSLQSQGYRHGGHEGLPRLESCTFGSGYPFGKVKFTDTKIPLDVTLTGWSPFIPNDDIASGLPAAFLEYRFENTSDRTVEFDFSFHLSHLLGDAVDRKSSHWSNVRSRHLSDVGVFFDNSLAEEDENFGSAALIAIGWKPQIKATWLRGGWFDGLSALWREVSTGTFKTNDGSGLVDDPNSRSGGSISITSQLKPGEVITLPVAIIWHLPNCAISVGCAPLAKAETISCGPDCDSEEPISPAANNQWSPFYAGVWKSAEDCASYVLEHFESLRNRTLSFSRALLGSTLPIDVLDALSSNLAILKSPTILRQKNGNIWAWEGCFTEYGSCHGSCTHVWNYAQAMPHLFSKLERTLREQELVRSIDANGHVNFRSALPDGPAPHDYHAASDGQLGGILKLYRDWQIFGDREWLERLYPQAKLSLDYCIALWDPDKRGGLFEPHHNTYDIEFWGPDGMCGSIYLGALSAMAALAAEMGNSHDASVYGSLAEVAAKFMSDQLFNGEYFQQNVEWDGLHNHSFAESIKDDGSAVGESMALLRKEGPKYQYGPGCLSDGIIGDWMARIYGVQTPIDDSHVVSTLKSIFRYNFKEDLFDHACLQRPGYAMGHEQGLLLCSWPRGGKPTLPFVYSDEVWTGIEYQVASHMIEMGMVDEALAIVTGVRSRYNGRVRNPFNEYECGSYYARAMASYALLGSLSGFRYNASNSVMRIAPKVDVSSFESFFSTATCFGTFKLSNTFLQIEILEGQMTLDTAVVTWNGVHESISVGQVLSPGASFDIPLSR